MAAQAQQVLDAVQGQLDTMAQRIDMLRTQDNVNHGAVETLRAEMNVSILHIEQSVRVVAQAPRRQVRQPAR